MLSGNCIKTLLGKEIIIYPYDEKKLKGVGYNLSVGPYIWSVTRKCQLIPSGEYEFEIEPGELVLVLTEEIVWVSERIGGTFHSKVDQVSRGISPISTTLDPGWIGVLLVAVRNTINVPLKLTRGRTFVTLIFHSIEGKYDYAKGQVKNVNPPGRLDRVIQQGIVVSPESDKWVNEDFRRDVTCLKEKVVSEETYRAYKKNSFPDRIVPLILPLTVLILIGFTIDAALRGGQQMGSYFAAIAATVVATMVYYLPRR
jgi:deoxycytidine triphosphate deaminase